MSDHIPTPLIVAVRTLLHAQVYARLKREQIDAVHLEILTECPIYDAAGNPILKSGNLYLAVGSGEVGADVLCQDFYAEADHRLKAAGFKPEGMNRDHCPALVAEHLEIEAGHELIKLAGAISGINELDDVNGSLELRKELLDLVTAYVVSNSPADCFRLEEVST